MERYQKVMAALSESVMKNRMKRPLAEKSANLSRRLFRCVFMMPSTRLNKCAVWFRWTVESISLSGSQTYRGKQHFDKPNWPTCSTSPVGPLFSRQSMLRNHRACSTGGSECAKHGPRVRQHLQCLRRPPMDLLPQRTIIHISVLTASLPTAMEVSGASNSTPDAFSILEALYVAMFIMILTFVSHCVVLIHLQMIF